MSREIIKLLGEKLAAKINKRVMPSTGLIQLGLRDDFGTIEDIDFGKLKHSINNGVKKRLENIGISDSLQICNYLLMELIKNQSLLTMSNF